MTKKQTIALASEAALQISKMLQENAELISPAIASAFSGIKAVQDAVESLTSSIDLTVLHRIEDAVRIAADRYEYVHSTVAWWKEERDCRIILKDYQWLLTYETPALIVKDINKTNEQTRETELERIFLSVIEEDNYSLLTSIVDGSAQSPIMSPFHETIRIGVELFHKSGSAGEPNYHRVLIPSLIPIIDRVYTDIAKIKFGNEHEYKSLIDIENQMVSANTNKIGKDNYQKVISAHEQRREKIAKNAIYWLGATDFITSLFDKNVLDHRFLNRNAILHGRRADFGNRQNSARLFLLLKFLLELEQELPSLEISDNPWLTPWDLPDGSGA